MTKWDKLHTSEQEFYVEMITALISKGRLPEDMSDCEIMGKAIRMYECDTHQDINDEDYLKDWFKL
jgi:mRNA-degrading endonuclease YafQ of YafQ-DinJ toxin-antitoxin module